MCICISFLYFRVCFDFNTDLKINLKKGKNDYTKTAMNIVYGHMQNFNLKNNINCLILQILVPFSMMLKILPNRKLFQCISGIRRDIEFLVFF